MRWWAWGCSTSSKRLPPGLLGSPDAEDYRSLHDEVDHRRGALSDHERHGYRPPAEVQKREAQMVEADLHGEGNGVEHHDRDEPGGAGCRLKRPPAVDQVRGDGADNEAGRFG